MKPRTKLQHRVTVLSKRFPGITANQKEWAKKECLYHLGYANKTSAFCLDCGEEFSLQIINRKRATCPSCKNKIKIENTRKIKFSARDYFAIAEVIEEFQVVRYFTIEGRYRKGNKADYVICEVLQHWINPNGKLTMIGRTHAMNGYCDYWHGEWSIRTERNTYWYQNKYDVIPYKYHPQSKYLPELKKIGVSHRMSGLTVFEAMKIIPKEPKAETLLKAKQYSLFSQFSGGYISKMNRYWPSIKICLRNKYKVNDASTWFDYLDLLSYFKKDLRNAKYVCPKNLKSEHDKLVKKKRKKQEAEEIEQQRLRAIERQKNLEKAVERFEQWIELFKSLEFKKGDILIKPLLSTEEFKEEGDELKHCLYTNEYYLKDDSLVLSARVNGIRTETIEVQLSSLKIIQSRGLGNKETKYHRQIVTLVKKNLDQISELLTLKEAA